MNSNTPSELLENIQEKYMSAIQLHTGLGDRDLGAMDLALGMALGDLDAAWQRHYDVLMVSADELAHDNARLLAKVQAITESTVNGWRNGNGNHATPLGFHPVTVGGPIVIVADAAKLAAAEIEPQEADEGNDPLVLAGLPDEKDDAPPFPFQWTGLPSHVLAAIADLQLGRPWRIVQPHIKKEIVLATIRELAAAQHDSEPLTIADFDRSRPHWMPSFPPLSTSLGMTWTQMRSTATSHTTA